MAATKVLVVDDALTMRVLISGALERIPNVGVVGLADGAAEARAMVDKLKPHAMTLDVEMPVMSGIDYPAEVMGSKPMPVIMFSTRTTAGAADSVEALRLGAIHCFPNPPILVAHDDARSGEHDLQPTTAQATAFSHDPPQPRPRVAIIGSPMRVAHRHPIHAEDGTDPTLADAEQPL